MGWALTQATPRSRSKLVDAVSRAASGSRESTRIRRVRRSLKMLVAGRRGAAASRAAIRPSRTLLAAVLNSSWGIPRIVAATSVLLISPTPGAAARSGDSHMVRSSPAASTPLRSSWVIGPPGRIASSSPSSEKVTDCSSQAPSGPASAAGRWT